MNMLWFSRFQARLHKIRRLSVICLLMGPATGIAMPITVGDREWMQPSEVTGFEWGDIFGVCSELTGACGDTLLGGTIDLSGWTWASVDDVGELFSALTPHEGGQATVDERDSTWAPAFFELFVPTSENSLDRTVWGWTRTRQFVSTPFTAEAPSLTDSAPDSPFPDSATTRRDVVPGTDHPTLGAWFHRSATVQVPEPGTLALLALGLAATGLARRRVTPHRMGADPAGHQ